MAPANKTRSRHDLGDICIISLVEGPIPYNLIHAVSKRSLNDHKPYVIIGNYVIYKVTLLRTEIQDR
jgi:hypothetical protein